MKEVILSIVIDDDYSQISTLIYNIHNTFPNVKVVTINSVCDKDLDNKKEQLKGLVSLPNEQAGALSKI